MPSLPKSLFSRRLDVMANAWLKTTHAVSQPEALLAKAMLDQALREVAETLLIAPRATLQVYGENVVLPLLTHTFGAANVEELLHEKCIEFILWQHPVAVLQDESLIAQGVYPLAVVGRATNPEHSDPHVSAEKGLNMWGAQQKISPAQRQRLIDLAAKRTVLPEEWIPEYALERVQTAYEQGELCEFGFDPDVPFHKVDASQRHQLATMTTGLAEAAILLRHGYDLYHGADTWETLITFCSGIKSRGQARASAEQMLTIEGVPSIPALLQLGVISYKDVARLRQRKETKDFQAWLWSQPDPANAEQVRRAYLAALARPGKSLTDSRLFKPAHILTAVGVSLTVGALTTHLPWITQAAASLGVGVVDDVLVSKLAEKRNPRRFATDVVQPLLVTTAGGERKGWPLGG